MFEIPDSFEVQKPAWGTSWIEKTRPNIENEDQKKIDFGIQLGKGERAFQAAINVCGDNTSEALWISQNWLNDPAVIAAKDVYLKTVDTAAHLLDADALAAKLLRMADEMNASNTFYLLEGKDRLKSLELYAEIRGYIGKDKLNFSTNITHLKQINIKLVKAEPKIVEVAPVTIEHNENNDKLSNRPPIKLKLVS